MHSRAFQVSRTPISTEDWIHEEELCFEDGMPIPVADYIVDSNDRLGDIEWLTENLALYNKGLEKPVFTFDATQSMTFYPGFAKAYFEPKFKEFKEASERLTLNDFMDRFGVERFAVQMTLDEKYGFYIYDDQDGYFVSLDAFIRRIGFLMEHEHLESMTYYFGGTLDYHC